MTDWLIFGLAVAVALAATLLRKSPQESLLFSIWAIMNLWLITIIDSSSLSLYWATITEWAILFAVKDFALMQLAGFLSHSRTITYTLASSCIFHQVILAQILTYNWDNVTLMNYRSDFMFYLSVIVLTTITYNLIGGGSNGGKRIGNHRFSSDRRLYNLFYLERREVRP